MPATPAATTPVTPVTPAIPVTLVIPVTPAAVRTTIPALLAPIQAQPPRPPSGRLWHATVAQAQAYAAGAAAQRGWTGNDWDCLVKLWTRESSWLWYAENASSGAYGIPQSLPADKMAAFGANYRDDAAVQIDWGLWYIAQAYGSPSKAWQHSEQVGWY